MKYRHILIVGLILGLAVVAYGSHPYITNPGTLLDGFENVNDWIVNGTGATAANDMSIFKQGSQSIKLNAFEGHLAKITKDVSLDLSSGDGFSFWIYVVDATTVSSFTLMITSQTDWSKYFVVTFSPFVNGWNYRVLSKAEFSNIGGDSWGTMVKIRFNLIPQTGENASVYHDDLRFGIVGKPKVIITFDDGQRSVIDKAHPILAANNQRGVVFVVSNGIDSWVISA